MSSTKYTSPVLFSPQPTCLASTALFYIQASTSTSDINDVFGVPTDTAACFPSGWSTATTNYISPALCPSSYTAVYSSTGTISPLTETTVICCPSHYSSPGISLFFPEFYCTSQISQTTTLTESVISSGTFISLTTASRGGGWLKAHSIQVRYQSTDYVVIGTSTLAVVTSSPAASSSSQASSLPQTSSSSSSVAVAATDTPSENGLSQSAKIGIGISIPLIVISMVALGVWYLLRRRRYRTSPHLISPPPDMTAIYDGPGTDATSSRIPAADAELPAQGSDLPELGVELEGIQSQSNRERNSYVPRNTGLNAGLPAMSTTYSESPVNAASHDRSGHRKSSQSVEELERQLTKTREEKERIAKLSELSRLEEDLERQIAEQRR